jgi:hypothetical protein
MFPNRAISSGVNSHYDDHQINQSQGASSSSIPNTAGQLAQRLPPSSAISNTFQAQLALKQVGVHRNDGPYQGMRKVSMISSEWRDGTKPVYKKTFTLNGNQVLIKDKVLRNGQFETLGVSSKGLESMDSTQQALLQGLSGDFVANNVHRIDLVVGNHRALQNSHVVGFFAGQEMKFSNSKYDNYYSPIQQGNVIEDTFTFNQQTNTFFHVQKDVQDYEEDSRITSRSEFSRDKATPEFLNLFFGGERAIANWNASVSQKVNELRDSMARSPSVSSTSQS